MTEKGSEGSGFRVVDKRRFDDSGETRSDSERVERDEGARSEQQSAQRPGENLSQQARPQAPSAQRPSRQPASQEPRPDGGAGTVDFSSLIMSLATQALVMMGEIPTPDGSRGTRNLEGAQQTIDIISLLMEKTQGNLTTDEHRLIDEVLAQLRLAFVNSVGK